MVAGSGAAEPGNQFCGTMGAACTKVSTDKLPGLMDAAEDGKGELVLANSMITAEGAQVIASRLAPSSLLLLDLSDNEIEDAGAVAICEALAYNESLRRLVLKGNRLTDAAVQKMVTALMPNRYLRCLDLYGNQITALGAQHLRRLLQRTHHLEILVLGANSLGDDGVAHLCRGMRKNHRGKLRRLGLSANGITNVGAERLWLLIDKRVRSIEECILRFNDINDYHLIELVDAACEKNAKYTAMAAWSKGSDKRRTGKRVGTVDKLTGPQLQSIKTSFRKFDRDGDGSVDASEVEKVMQDLGNTYDDQTLQDMISDADVNGSGVIEETEFIAMMARQLALSESEEEDDSGDSDVSDEEQDKGRAMDDGTFNNPMAEGADETVDT